MPKSLLVLLGPTGVGKTDLSISLAEKYGCDIISADSRQLFREIPIGTAAPSMQMMERVKHHFVGTLRLDEYYSASRYEEEAMLLLSQLFVQSDVALLTGGSMMYIDSLCNGIDDIPTIDSELRSNLMLRLEHEGLDSLRLQLKMLDPEYYSIVDLQNPKRVVHGLEVCLMSGRTYTSFCTKVKKERPFSIIKIGLTREREELYERINSRVEQMIADGLVEEARRVYPYKGANSLKTVGYKELFAYFEGDCSFDDAVQKIKQNSRIYSRKQMTWFRRDEEINWFHPDDSDNIMQFLQSKLFF